MVTATLIPSGWGRPSPVACSSRTITGAPPWTNRRIASSWDMGLRPATVAFAPDADDEAGDEGPTAAAPRGAAEEVGRPEEEDTAPETTALACSASVCFSLAAASAWFFRNA